MIFEIKNSELCVKISSHGAELQSIVYNKREYLWQGNPDFWSNRATVLFPVVGRCLNNEIVTDNGSYPIGQHGFARYMEFEAESVNADSCTLILKSNSETKKHYPYDFIFRVTYRLDGKRLINRFETENTGSEELFYAIGGHPGFSCPPEEGAFGNWEIITEFDEPLLSLPVTNEGYIIGERTIPVEHKEGHIALKRSLFKNDALIFDNIKSKKLTLRNINTGIGASVEFADFPAVGIWTLPKDGADYVCLEPWCGMAHNINESGRLDGKRDLVKLEAGGKCTKSFTIEVF